MNSFLVRIRSDINSFLAKMSIIKDFLVFVKRRKKWWMLPIVILLLLFGVFIVLMETSALAPLLYTLF